MGDDPSPVVFFLNLKFLFGTVITIIVNFEQHFEIKRTKYPVDYSFYYFPAVATKRILVDHEQI